jgi:NAD(P)-dependent dehydrogenase (short-subunit alcohol dehydrogenase family)
MTKAMVDLLTLALSLEHARESIRANTICPGLVDTPIHETYMSPEEAAQRLEEGKRVYPLGRIGTPEDIARAALYLASDDASWISGITLLVDGGRWLSK